MQIFEVDKNIPLFEYLQESLPGIKRNTLKNYLRFQSVFVNGKPVSKFDHPLVPGDKITLERDKQKAQTERLKSNLKIMYEDQAIIVIDKPAGLLTIATDKIKTRTAFYEVSEYLDAKKAAKPGIQRRRPSSFEKQLFIVHRLDRDASGLLIFAKNADAKYFLQDNWHEFQKKYYAVVEGTPAETEGEISSYLKENKILRVFSSPEETEGSKFAITQYRVLKSAHRKTLMEVTLQTGRKHQIRVHMAQLGHPILGDKDYGNKGLSKRLALHSFSLSVTHPVTRKAMHFHTALPKELESLIN